MGIKRSFPHKAPEHGHIPGQHKSMTLHQGEAVCVMSWCWCRIEYLRWAQCPVPRLLLCGLITRGEMLSASHRHHGGIAILWGICCLLFSTFPGTAAPMAVEWSWHCCVTMPPVTGSYLSWWAHYSSLCTRVRCPPGGRSTNQTMHYAPVSPPTLHQSHRIFSMNYVCGQV